VEPAAEVTDEEVENLIDSKREAKKELQEITNRSIVQEGDVVNIDYVGRIDGEEFDGGSAEGYNLEIGSNSFIEGFESGLVGAKVGDTVTLELTFPEDYADSTKAGVDAEFDVTVNSIQQYVVPDLTDEFVASLELQDEFGNVVGTVDEFRAYARNYLIESNESQYTQRLEEAIRTKLMENSTFKQDVPQAMVERIYDSMGQELSSYAQQYGVDLKTLMQLAYGSTEDSYLQDIKDLAAENAKTTIILQAVADAEKLSMSDADFQAELEKAISSTTGYTSVNDVPKEDIEAYREALDKRSAMDFLKNKATVIAPVAGEGNTGATAAEEEAAQ
jgi:trigger factor